MRILYFSYAYPNAVAPTQGTFNRSLLAALARRHEVRVVSPVSFVESWRGRLNGKSPFDSRYVAVPGIRADYVPFYYPPRLFRERFGDFLWWSVRKQFEQAVREFRPDVILSYWAHPDGDVAVRMGRRHDIPVVTMVGGSDVLVLARVGRRRESILNVLHEADAVVTVGRNLAETLISDGISADKLHVVRRGIDDSVFHPGDQLEERAALGLPARRFTLVSVGRLVPVKGQTHLLAACARLHQAGHSFACYLLGNGPLRGAIEQEVRACGLEDMIHFPGTQSQDQLARWYRAADATVLPSLSEGIPNVLLESISCGTPFIASDVGGIPEIADSRLDDLVPPANPTALSEAIRQRIVSQRSGEKLPPRRFLPGSWDDSARELCAVFAGLGVHGGDSAKVEEHSLQLSSV